jgi:flavodoxin short chain
MAKALIIYGSTTGNTESMAETIREALDGKGLEAEARDVADCAVSDLNGDHDLLLLGCPAYGDDEIELQDDFIDFYDQWDGVRLDGKPFAVFAPGDSSYEYFCGSVDMLEDKMADMGGQATVDGLKIDGDPADFEEEIIAWAGSVADSLG